MAKVSVADASGKLDFRSTNKRRGTLLVMFVAFLLPLLLTSSYIYYNLTPHTSTEAVTFFRPFSSFVPPKEDSTDNFMLSENDPSGSDIQVEPKTEDSSVLGFSVEQQSQANVTTTAALENSIPTMVEIEASEPKAASDDRSNNPNSEIDNTENTSKPEEGNTEADAMAELRGKGRKVSSSISPDVNPHRIESDEAWKQSKVPDEDPDNHQQSEESVIAVKTHNQGVCDLVKGGWVPDSRPPPYGSGTCRHIQEHQNCKKNGRPDMGYLNWKWQPEQCELPQIDVAAFLNAMRDKSMYFVGDSLARNQFQSLLCILSQAEMPDHTYQGAGDKDNVHVFRSHNFTLAMFWSTHLVHIEQKLITHPDNSTEDVIHIHLDKLDKAWVEHVPGIDILQISTGQWWFKRALFHVGGQPIGCHWWAEDGHTIDEWKECPKVIGFAGPYQTTIHNVLQESLSIPGYTGTTVLRTFAPDHFEDGEWHNGGKCVRTRPGGVPMKDLTRQMYDIQVQEFQNFTGTLSASDKKRIRLLDITNLSQVRSDGHPDAYRNFQPFLKESKQRIERDCLHWCLPGPIDTWNELLVETLRQ